LLPASAANMPFLGQQRVSLAPPEFFFESSPLSRPRSEPPDHWLFLRIGPSGPTALLRPPPPSIPRRTSKPGPSTLQVGGQPGPTDDPFSIGRLVQAFPNPLSPKIGAGYQSSLERRSACFSFPRLASPPTTAWAVRGNDRWPRGRRSRWVNELVASALDPMPDGRIEEFRPRRPEQKIIPSNYTLPVPPPQTKPLRRSQRIPLVTAAPARAPPRTKHRPLRKNPPAPRPANAGPTTGRGRGQQPVLAPGSPDFHGGRLGRRWAVVPAHPAKPSDPNNPPPALFQAASANDGPGLNIFLGVTHDPPNCARIFPSLHAPETDHPRNSPCSSPARDWTAKSQTIFPPGSAPPAACGHSRRTPLASVQLALFFFRARLFINGPPPKAITGSFFLFFCSQRPPMQQWISRTDDLHRGKERRRTHARVAHAATLVPRCGRWPVENQPAPPAGPSPLPESTSDRYACGEDESPTRPMKNTKPFPGRPRPMLDHGCRIPPAAARPRGPRKRRTPRTRPDSRAPIVPRDEPLAVELVTLCPEEQAVVRTFQNARK